MVTPHRRPHWLVDAKWRHQRGATKLVQHYWVLQGQTRQTMCIEHKNDLRSHNHGCCGQAMSIKIFWVCFCILALIMRHAKRMPHIVLSSVTCPTLPYFSTLSHKRNDFRQQIFIKHHIFVLIFYKLLCESFHFRTIQQATIITGT
jgi:hypothetical protein